MATTVAAFASMAVAALGDPDSASAQGAQPWPTKEFDVISAEVLFPITQSFNAVSEQVDEWLVASGMEPAGARIYVPHPETRREIEDYLTEAAGVLESWGFPPPKLHSPFGAYKIVLAVDTPAGLTGLGVAGSYHGTCAIIGGHIFLNANVILGEREEEDGRRPLTPAGRSTLAHELFHAVQASTRFHGAGCPPSAGTWITEGTADAIGIDILRRLRGEVRSDWIKGWGARDYSKRLPVPQSLLPQGWTEDRMAAYYTSSFWRYLAEFQALRSAPGPEINPFDYSYLAEMLSRAPASSDCSGSAAECGSELRWLTIGLRENFGLTLRELYPLFAAALALYGDHRLPDVLGNDRMWRSRTFGDCPYFELTPRPNGRIHRDVIPTFEPVSTHCWEVVVPEFGQITPVEISVKAPPGGRAIADLSAAVAGLPIRADTAVVDTTATGELTARWVVELPHDRESVVILTNVANDPANTTRMVNLPITFTALEPYAVITHSPDPSITSSPGPSGDEVDRPLGVRFDRNLKGVVSDMTETLYRRDPGLTQPCLLAVPGLSNAQGDALSFFMDHEGPIGPGDYPVMDATRDTFGYRGGDRGSTAPPGTAVVNFTLGFLNQPPAQQLQNFVGIAGTLKVELVAGRFVTGVLDVVGENSRAEDIALEREEPPANYLPGAAIRVEFGLLMQDPSDPVRHSGATDCLTSNPGAHRKASGNGGTPTGSPDPPSDDPGPPAEEAPPSESEAGSGLPADGAREPTADPPEDPGGNEAADATRPAEAATAHLGAGKTRWVRVWAKDRPDLSFSGSDLDGSAGATFTCWTGNPVNISLYEGDSARNATLGVILITTPDIPEGATGTYRIDQVLYVFQGGALGWRGPVTLELTRHDASTDPGARRVAGRILGLRVVDRTTDALIPIEAEFDVNAACAPFGR